MAARCREGKPQLSCKHIPCMLAFKVPEDAVQATWEVKTPVILANYGPRELQYQPAGQMGPHVQQWSKSGNQPFSFWV